MFDWAMVGERIDRGGLVEGLRRFMAGELPGDDGLELTEADLVDNRRVAKNPRFHEMSAADKKQMYQKPNRMNKTDRKRLGRQVRQLATEGMLDSE